MAVAACPPPLAMWMRLACWLLPALAALLASPSWAIDAQLALRDLRIAHWGVDDGLPQIAVLAIAQDRDGYLWIGTQNGIARFDGTRFSVHDRNSSGVDTTLASSILVDSTNRVWFGTPRGALRLENDQVHALARDGAGIGVTAIAEQADGGILFATEGGLYQADGNRLRALPGHAEPTYALLADGDRLWSGGLGHVRDINQPGRAPIALPDPATRINVIRRHRDALWLGTDRGLLRVDPASGDVARVDPALDGFAVSALLWDRDGNLWIGSDTALLRYGADGRVARTDGAEFGVQLWIHDIIEGREGQLWVGTHRDSLLRLTGSSGSVVSERDGLSDAFVWSLLKDARGQLLIGTNSGLERLGSDGRARRVVEGRDLPDPSIYTLAPADDGAYWLGTRHGLALWRDGAIASLPALDPLKPFQINAILRNAAADYWIATTNGLYRYRDGLLEHLPVEAGSSVARVRGLLRIGPDDLLIGTEDGLRRVRGGRIERVSWASQLDQSFVTRLAWIGPDLLAIGTMDRGLGLVRLPRGPGDHVDPATLDQRGPLRLVDIDNGLSSRNIWTLDRIDDHLYIGSIQGVYRVALRDLPDPASTAPVAIEMQYVYAAPGRNARSLQRLACCNGGGDARSLLDGKSIWYATTDGAVRIDSDSIPPRPQPPLPHVEKVRSGSSSYRPGQAIAISGPHRDPAIEYTGLSLIDSEMIQFRYQLLGYDHGWQNVHTRRVAYYTHLPPGDYRFVVQARHPTGPWSANSAELPLRIVPYWYEHRGLQALAALLLLLLAGWALRRRGRSGDRRRVQLERAVAERTEALQRAVGSLREANAALAQESRTDPLTGLSNRRLDPGRVAADGTIALLDLDHFKDINDRHGHASGDVVLVELAGLLKKIVNSDDQVVRWGGEEFLLLLAARPMADALQFGEALRRSVATHPFRLPSGDVIQLTCSIGLAEHPAAGPRGQHWHGALELADAALYQAKRSGRNRTVGVRVKPADAETPAPERTPPVLAGDHELEWIDAQVAWHDADAVARWQGLAGSGRSGSAT